MMNGSSGTITHLMATSNNAGRGVAISLRGSGPTIEHAVVVNNTTSSSSGSAVYVSTYGGVPSFKHVILAYNGGYNLYHELESGVTPQVTWSEVSSTANSRSRFGPVTRR